MTGTLTAPPGRARAAAPELERWLAKARRAGLDDESIEALFASTFGSASEEDIGEGAPAAKRNTA